MDRVHVVELLHVSVVFLVAFLYLSGIGCSRRWVCRSVVGGGGGLPFSGFYAFPGWSPCVSHFGNVLAMWVWDGYTRLWNLCRLCSALLFSGSTILLEGDSVAPNGSRPVIR